MKKETSSYLPREPFRWKKIIQYLLQGLLILAPLAITIYSIYWIVSTVDNWLPIFREPVKDFQGNIIGHKVKNYGLGFVVVLSSIITIGYLSSFFIQSKIFSLFDSWLEKTPGIKFIYSSVRDFFGAFAGEKKKFNTAILANVFADDRHSHVSAVFVRRESNHTGDKGCAVTFVHFRIRCQLPSRIFQPPIVARLSARRRRCRHSKVLRNGGAAGTGRCGDDSHHRGTDGYRSRVRATQAFQRKRMPGKRYGNFEI